MAVVVWAGVVAAVVVVAVVVVGWTALGVGVFPRLRWYAQLRHGIECGIWYLVAGCKR